MKKLVGSDIGTYSFDPVNKLVTFNNCGLLSLSNILLITNVTSHILIYNFADSNTTGTLNGNVLTLAYNTTAMGVNDVLQIYIDTSSSQGSTLPVLPVNYTNDDIFRLEEKEVMQQGLMVQYEFLYGDINNNMLQLFSGESGNRYAMGQSGMSAYLFEEVR